MPTAYQKEGEMLGSFRRAAVALTVAGVLMVASASASAAVVTVSLPAQAELTAGVLVTVPVTVTCGPYEVPSSDQRSGLQVTIRQASKKAIASGSSFSGGFDNFLTCDGAPHVYQTNVFASSGVLAPPFKKGDAVIDASAFVATDCCTSDTGTAGPQVIRLR